MKNMKRIGCLLLVVAMCLALGVSAFAATGDGQCSITIQNSVVGQTYYVYKIFDATYTENVLICTETDSSHEHTADCYTTAVSYTIDSNSPWFSLVSAVSNLDVNATNLYFTLIEGETKTVGEGAEAKTVTTYSVQRNESASDSEIIEWVKGCITVDEETGQATLSNGTAISPENVGGTEATDLTLTIGNLDPGYYFVTTTTGSVVSVTTADPDATIFDKNEVIDIKKVVAHYDEYGNLVNTDSAEADGMSETVSFDVTANVPIVYTDTDENPTGQTRYVTDYTVTDSMTNGLLIELTEGQFHQGVAANGEDPTKYYLNDDVINAWITIYAGEDSDGNLIALTDGYGNTISFTNAVYNYSFELVGYDTYTDKLSGETVHTFSGFVLTYYTYDVKAYDTAYAAAAVAAGATYVLDGVYYYDYQHTQQFIWEDAESYFQSTGENASKYPANAVIEIAYDAKVSSLEGYENTNTITLNHNYTPFDTPTPESPTPGAEKFAKDYIYSWELSILKIDGNGTETPLEGATFTLESDAMSAVKVGHSWIYVPVSELTDETYTYTDPNTGDSTEYRVTDFESTYYQKTGDTYVVVASDQVVDEDGNYKDAWKDNLGSLYRRILISGVDVESDTEAFVAEGTTDKNGQLYFEGLGEGVYKLTEIVAPEGYNLITEPIYFRITWKADSEGATTGSFTIEYGTYDEKSGDFTPYEENDPDAADYGGFSNGYILEMQIENAQGTILPGTGGIGTTIFYIVGACLVVGAVVVLVTRKRVNGEPEA